MYERIVYIICDDFEREFYKLGEYYTTDPLQASLFFEKTKAEYYFNKALSSFQKKIFTKIIPVRVTMTKD